MQIAKVVVGPLLREAGDSRAAADRAVEGGDQSFVGGLVAVEHDGSESA
ncbi:MAG TPA: hypothetical protein VJY34_04205 [Roseiarcus sp.]|nr:hypothetical protein [Roseiarcus sp.]